MIKSLSIIIPAFNEGNSIREILEKVKEVQLINNISKEIIIVNDCSTDNTEEVIKEYVSSNSSENIRYYKHVVNMGKGAAMHTGIQNATGEYLIIQDADLEYDPEEYNKLLKPVIRGSADVVYGSRFMGENPHRVLFFWHTVGNKFLTGLSNMLTNLNLTDMETCYKLFDTKILQSLSLEENRFGFEPEVTAKISKVENIRIYEVGISYYGRTFAEGKKINWKDGFRAIFVILKYNIFNGANRGFIAGNLNLFFLIISLLTIMFFFFSYNSGYGYDALEYLNIGRAMTEGKPLYYYVPSKSPLFYGYVYFLYKVFGTIGHLQLSIILAMQFLVSGLICYWCTSNIANKNVARDCSILFLGSAFFTEMNFLEPELLLSVLGIIAFMFFVNDKKKSKRSNINLIVTGTILGLGCLVKTVSFFYLVAFVIIQTIYQMVGSSRNKDYLTSFFYIITGFLLPLAASWIYFNSNETSDKFIFWTFIFPFKFYRGDNVFLGKTLIKLSPFLLIIITACFIYKIKVKSFATNDRFIINSAIITGLISLIPLYKSQASHYVFPALYFLILASVLILYGTVNIEWLKKRFQLHLGVLSVLFALIFISYRPDAARRLLELKTFNEEKVALSELERAGVRLNSKGIIFHDDSWLYYLLETKHVLPFVSTDAQGGYFLEKNYKVLFQTVINEEPDYIIFDPASNNYRSQGFLSRKNIQTLKQLNVLLNNKYVPHRTSTFSYLVWVKKQTSSAKTNVNSELSQL